MSEFLTTPLGIGVMIVAQVLAVVAFVMVSLLFLVYGDRKIWAAVQMRRGPNVVGAWGLLQTVADALKYIERELDPTNTPPDEGANNTQRHLYAMLHSTKVSQLTVTGISTRSLTVIIIESKYSSHFHFQKRKIN